MAQNRMSPCLSPAVLVKPGVTAAKGPRAGLLCFLGCSGLPLSRGVLRLLREEHREFGYVHPQAQAGQ